MKRSDGSPSATRTGAERLNRRTYLKGLAALGTGAATGAGVIAGGSEAVAAASRSSYAIRTGTSEETTVHVVDGAEPGPTVMVVGGMHGDEPAGYDSAARVADWTIDRGELVVLPEACKPAIADASRTYDDGDLNRHFPAGSDPESPLARAIWDVVTDEDVDFLLDLHSSHGLYEGGSGDGVGQGVFSTQAGDAHRRRGHLQSYLNDNFVENSAYEFTGATSTDGSSDMLKHKVGADLGAPAIILETYRGIDDARQRMFTTTAVREILRSEGLIDETVTYTGDATAVDAPADDNDAESGLTFDVRNDAGQAVTLTDLEVWPLDDAADELRDHSYDEGRWVSELHVDADQRAGVTDIDEGASLPATIDLDADGHDYAASTEPVLSGGSSATVSLYQFERDGAPVGMADESVAMSLRYEMADGTRGFSEFTVSGDGGLEYNGDVTAVDAPEDGNHDSSGLRYSVTNDTGEEATILNLTIDAWNDAVDQLRDHSYSEGKWVSEVYIDADVQDGLTDVDEGASLTTTIDLDADGHSDDAQRNAVLSAGSTAEVFLYQFRSGEDAADMLDEVVTVSTTYKLADGRVNTAIHQLQP